MTFPSNTLATNISSALGYKAEKIFLEVQCILHQNKTSEQEIKQKSTRFIASRWDRDTWNNMWQLSGLIGKIRLLSSRVHCNSEKRPQELGAWSKWDKGRKTLNSDPWLYLPSAGVTDIHQDILGFVVSHNASSQTQSFTFAKQALYEVNEMASWDLWVTLRGKWQCLIIMPKKTHTRWLQGGQMVDDFEG